MTISVAVMHHPLRGELVQRLLSGLEGADVELVQDPDPWAKKRSPWRTQRHALETTPAGATHRVVIQDDAQVCRDFPTVLERAITARPDRMLVLCVCGEPSDSADAIYAASRNGWSWARLDPNIWVPAIAVVWPVRLIRPSLDWVDEQGWPEAFTADDEIIGRIVRERRETVLATVPSLVHHDDLADGVASNRTQWGKAPGRVTACYVPECCDPLTIDWTVGPD